ncbi:MAG: hypothetical protein Q4C97_05745 [Bacillota bacterium]|nr:hypothetical protein [Bacillota bacterium]
MGQKDLVLRTYLSDEKRFADLFNTYLGEREIFPEFLRELESVRIRKDEETQKVKRVEHDLLKIYEKKDKYYILGIQNQEKVDYQMIIRCMAYELEEYERQIRELQKEHQMRGAFIEENRKIFQNLSEDAYDVIRVYGGIREMKKIKEKYRVEGGIDMCKAWEEMKADERIVGKKIGEDNLAELMKRLIGEDRMKDLKKALENKKYRKKLYREFGIE